jgi:subfamily B ATP-binding cassette protein MsbA
MKTLIRLFQFARPYSKYWPKYIFFTFFGTIFGIFNFGLIKPLLDVIFDPKAMTTTTQLPPYSFSINYVIEAFNYFLTISVQQWGQMGALLFVAVAVVIASFLANILKYGGQRVMASLRTDVIFNIREALFNKITRLNIGYFNKRQKGDVMSVLSNDINEVQNNITQSFQIIFREPFLIVGYFGALFYMSYQLTLITVVAVPISGWCIGKLTRKLRSAAGKSQSALGTILSVIEETISGIRIIKAFNAQGHIRIKFAQINKTQTDLQRNIYNRQELATPTSEFLGVSVAMLILLAGGWLILQGKLSFSLSGFVTYLAFYYSILLPLKNIASASANIRKGMASADRIFGIIDAPVAIQKDKNPIAIEQFKQDIRFKDVSFAYNEELVLKNVNLTIPKGKMIALVGQSGAGKSTIADLIPRFYDVSSGAILLDGIDIRQYQPKELMALMGIVTQEAILFNDTIKNNIAFGLNNVITEEVIEAAKVANAHEFILQTEYGYDTNIGDRGARLSGGQRQRIAIARAVLKNPPILILDEATSALDTESEHLVQDALAKLMQNRTSIVIAHRLSTIQNADCIVALQNGEIVEQGTHAELLHKTGGVYKKLCAMQSFKD